MLLFFKRKIYTFKKKGKINICARESIFFLLLLKKMFSTVCASENKRDMEERRRSVFFFSNKLSFLSLNLGEQKYRTNV
jgi:hypothetical protein